MIPSRRVGALVRAARSRAGLSVRAAAHRIGVPRATVQAWERGEERVADEHLETLAELYGVTVEALAPARRGVVIDLDQREMRVGHRVEALATTDPTPDDILAKYLSVLYELRGARPTDPIPLRDDDLSSLADVLGNKPSAVEARLVELMGVTGEEAMRLRRIILRRRVLTPAAGIVLGAGMLGGFTRPTGPPAVPPATSARSAPSARPQASSGPAKTTPPAREIKIDAPGADRISAPGERQAGTPGDSA
ncbi:MAG: helix-turn-helix domain-containing protein [Acidimicrobiia bacterium]